MVVAAEVLNHSLSLATGEIAGVSPAYILAGAAAIAGSYNLKKFTPAFHKTINDGEVGVPLRRGRPIERPLTEAEVRAGESKYKILGPGWYFVPLFRTIQTVFVTDQLDSIRFPLDAEDGPQVMVHANVTWKVDSEGDSDSPVRSITAVRHQKTDKKEIADDNGDDEDRQALKRSVLGICGVALGQTLTGRKANDLRTLNKSNPAQVQQETIERAAERLREYGVVLRIVELMPITRVGEEVLAQALVHSQNPHLLGAATLLSRTADDGESVEADTNGHSKVVSLRSSEPV